MADLRTRILAKIDGREQVARAAHDSLAWEAIIWPRRAGRSVLTAFFNVHDPADALRRYAAARRVVERHKPADQPGREEAYRDCEGCGCNSYGDYREIVAECPDLLDIADSLGIDATTQDGES